jgi:hypothetical protein
MLARSLAVIIAVLAGGWMIFDGMHVLLRGKYFGPEKPGPWSGPFVRLGVDPFALGPLFIVLGVGWLVCLVAMLAGQTWGWYGGAIVAIATLWYAPPGTVLSLAYLIVFYVTILRGAR